MDEKHYAALLEVAKVIDQDSWVVVPEERTITLHLASAGTTLSVSKASRLKLEGKILYAETLSGDLFVLALADVFAASIEGGKKTGRKAGFAT